MLDERKLKVLYAIIDSHLNTAEPIGSRTISKDYDLGVSAATIRNEMSDLEDRGYLIKPHSSAGRIPSDKAYRLYVDQLLTNNEKKELERNQEIKEEIQQETKQTEDIIKNSTRLLSQLTSYTAIAISPQINKLRLKHIQLMSMDGNNIILVLLNSSGSVQNNLFYIDEKIYNDNLFLISKILNDEFNNLTIDEIVDKIKNKDIFKIEELSTILDYILPFISKSLQEISETKIYIDGLTKILNFPEYRDIDKARDFMEFIEDEKTLINLISNMENEDGLTISIGEENEPIEMKHCSIITTNYQFTDKSIGKIGIIGPTRMDYLKLINIMDTMSDNINEIFKILMG